MEEGVFPLGSDPHEGVFRSVSEAEVSLDEMLSLACRQGKQDIVELLLESGANVNHRNKAGNTPLLEACSQGHVSIARLLLDRSADIDAPTETTYDSALTWACTLGNVEIVRLLLDRKANVEHRTKDGCTALMFAALAGHEKVAKLLLDHHAEINVESDSNKDSPLTFACWKGHQKVVELFLDRNADIEHRTKEGFSPLMFAALGGHTQVAELLLKHHAKVNNPSGSNNDIPLTSACWKGHHQVVYLLLQHDSDIEHRTKDGCTPLMLAAREGHLSVAQLLLDHGAQVNRPSGSENNIPLTLACWKGHRDVVNLLLKNVSNIEHQNKAGCTPLMLAAREGHQEATRLLLDSGAQINVPSGSNDDTPLTLACWKGHEEVVSLLIERNSNVNHQTKTGCTPLMEATREGHVGVAKLLLQAGADVETPDNYGQSPFFMACWKGHADVAALLLEYDANKDCRTKTGITPLFQACRENHVDVVKLLLDYGCNPSTPFPNSRECPLTLAAEKGYVELTQLLLSRSAHVEARTKKGCSPLYLACREGYKEIAVMLAKHGANTEAPDVRGTTPLLAAYKNGHVEVVEWLLAHVAHLPSDPECNKALLAPMPSDTDLAPQRSKCIELIMKAKKAREQAALKNAQSLCEELDAEKEKKESRRKAAAKKRDKRKKKKKEQAEKMDAVEVEKEDFCLPVDGREGPEGDEGEEPGSPPQPPPSPENVVAGEAMIAPPASTHHLQKKRNIRTKKSGKLGSPEAATPLPVDDGSDSGDDEYHDALPEFSPTEPPDYHHKDQQRQLRTISPAPLHPPSRPSATVSDHHHTPSSSGSTSSHDPKLLSLSSHTDMSTTRYGSGGQNNKRSPQPKAEVSATTSSSGVSREASRGSDTGTASVDRGSSDQVRGNQGAGMESSSGGGGSSDKRKGSKQSSRKSASIADKEGSNSNQWNNQRNRPRDVRGWAKTPSPTSAPIVATKGVSSNSSIPSMYKTENTSSEGKPIQSHSTRGKASATKETSSSSSRGQRSSHAFSAAGQRHPRDPSPSSSSVGSSNNETNYPSSAKHTTGSSWSKSIYSNPPPDRPHHHHHHHQQHSSTKPPSPYEDRGQYVWDSSQESDSGDWDDEVDLEDQLLWDGSCSTDDDKIRSRKLKAAAAAQQDTPTTRLSATSAYPTPTVSTSTSSTTTTYVSMQSWHEVTRPTRTVQLTVSNSLVGRIIGRGGSKINNIQVSSGAHINVSRNIPKSTERLVTIKGTQRSISKAQELIDEALSTPDSTVEVLAPSQERGPKAPLISTSPSVFGNLSDPPSSGVGVAPHRQVKRYSDIVPSKDSIASTTTSTSSISSSEPKYLGNKRVHPTPKELVRPLSTAGLTSTSDSYTAVVCSGNTRPGHGNSAWTSSSSTFASITAVTPSPTSQAPASSSPTSEEHLMMATSVPSPIPLKADSNQDRVLSPIQASINSHVEARTPSPERVGSNADFPPLTMPHSRSQSDPLVTSLPVNMPGQLQETSDTGGLTELQAPQGQHPPSVTSSWPLSSPPNLPPDQPKMEDTMLASAQLRSEKLPFVSSPKSPADADEGDGRGDAGLEGHTTSRGSGSLGSGNENVASSLVVGSRPPKLVKNVALIQPTQQQQQTSLPAKFLPPSSQSNSTPDLTSIPASSSSSSASSSSSRAGSYGAIGPPTTRRSSLPSAAARGPSRKYSHAGFLTTLNENDHLNQLPANFALPLNSTHSSDGWPSDRRVRSTSLTGPHPFIPQNNPFSQPQGAPFKPPNSHSSRLHSQSDDSVVGPPGTPDTPHGENHPMEDQDFSAPGGVYGAIGSNMPSSSAGGGTVGSASSRTVPSSITIRSSFNNSPLSSPRLPHPPPPPPNMKMHPSDIWIPPFGATGPRMHHGTPQIPPFGLPPFPHQHPHHHTFPRVPPHPKPSDSPHMFQRVHMNHQPKQHGDPLVPNMGFRHSLGEESSYRMGNGNVAPPSHKRWSVPSFPHGTHPSYFPSQAQVGGDTQHQQVAAWGGGAGGWPKHGPGTIGNKTAAGGGNVNGQFSGIGEALHSKAFSSKVGGGALSISDPWSPHWTVPPGGPGFPSPYPSRYNGMSISASSQSHEENGAPGAGVGSRVKTSRSISCVTEPSWSSLSREIGLEVGTNQSSTRATDLQQLMKSLDISTEHMQSLKARKLSLQQLHSMSDDEWRSLKLPVGPRVKLMNAISNIRKGDSSSQSSDGHSSEPSSFSADNAALGSCAN